MLFIFTATLNTESNGFDGGEGVEINSWILDVLIFPCLFGIQMEAESGTRGSVGLERGPELTVWMWPFLPLES